MRDQSTKSDAVEPSWRAFFQGFDFAIDQGEWPAQVAGGSTRFGQKEFQVVKLIEGYRTRGHYLLKPIPFETEEPIVPT